MEACAARIEDIVIRNRIGLRRLSATSRPGLIAAPITARRSEAGAARTASAPAAFATPDHPRVDQLQRRHARHQIDLLEAVPHRRVEQQAFGAPHRHDHALCIERIGQKPCSTRSGTFGSAERNATTPRETGA